MGATLFPRHPGLVAQAEQVLGMSMQELCSEARVHQTQHTQPALFIVNALSYLEWRDRQGRDPDGAAGHSLGEYNALWAAGAFDFVTGVRLVQKRGELMARATPGGMAAVLELPLEVIREVLERHRLDGLDLANDNAPLQQILSGPREELARAEPLLRAAGARFVPLKVSAPFHSRYMGPARESFTGFLRGFTFSKLCFPVTSNAEALPYESDRVAELLARQIDSPVRWTQSMRYLLARGEESFEELGSGQVLTGLVRSIRAALPAEGAAPRLGGTAPSPPPMAAAPEPGFRADRLGSKEFREAHGVRFAYVAGAMYKGIASRDLVARMGRAGMLGFFGTGGLRLERVEEELLALQAQLGAGAPYGMNLLHNLERPSLEDDTVDLFLRHRVRTVEAAAYLQLTPALVRYRVKGLVRAADGQVEAPNRIIAKVSRPEVARLFMAPPPEPMLAALVRAGRITPQEAQLARELPMAEDVCVESDSGGHTDQGVSTALLPAMMGLRDRMMAEQRFARRIRVGAAGGIGTPQAAASALVMGADFILTGSINQCTVEAGTSDAVKDLLETLDVQDVTYAPAGDMFELGAKVQVVRKGLFFPARANRLYALYQQYESLEALEPGLSQMIQEKYFRRSFEEVWEETRRHYLRTNPGWVELAENNPRKKMALVFRWYFVHTTRLAQQGAREQRVDYQVHCGPALGAFNQWVRGTPLESWRNRHVDEIGIKLMEETAAWLQGQLHALQGAA